MPTWFRAGMFAALFVFATTPSPAAEKTFQDDALNDAAITLEADLKDEAGTVEKPLVKLKQEADGLIKSQDLAGAADIYVQIVTVEPNDATAWRRLADLWLLIPATEEDDGSTRVERARTAAYIAYQRSTTPDEESASLVTLASAFAKREEWRSALDALKLALTLHASPELQAQYTALREKYGFRVANFSVDSDAASPRACFQFSETLPKRTDFSPFVSVVGQDKPALSVDEQQICVEGLQHGETYAITLRAGLPSTVGEDLLKDAAFNIYVRDRSPSVRLSGKAYVLPRSGQQGIPLVTVNTDLVKVTIYRIGDRALIDNVLGYEFERNLYSYNLDEIADQKGEKVWDGELKVEKELNQEITTAFPIMDAVPEMQPGVYLLAARPADVPGDDYGERTTQWFIVSDLGLTAYSGTDGIHAYVNSLASTDPLKDVEIRLLARNNEVLATKKTDADGAVAFEPGLARGEGGLAPALLIASGDGGDYAFLNLTQSAFDLTDRGVAGRDVPNGPRCLRVHRARRLSHRRDGACDDAVARRRRHRGSGRRPDHGGDAARRRGISPQRGARPGHRRALAGRAHHLLRTDRNLARRRLFGPEGGLGRRGVVPGRRLCAGSAGIRSHHQGHVDLAVIPRRDPARRPLPLWRARRGARHRGRGEHRQGGGAHGLSRLFVRPRCNRPGGSRRRRRHREHPARRPAADQRGRRGNLHRCPRQGARIEQTARGECRGAAGRAGRPRRGAQANAADRAQGEHDRREAAVLRPLAQRQRHGEFRCGDGRARRQADRRHGAQMAVAQRRVRNISGIAPTAIGATSRSR